MTPPGFHQNTHSSHTNTYVCGHANQTRSAFPNTGVHTHLLESATPSLIISPASAHPALWERGCKACRVRLGHQGAAVVAPRWSAGSLPLVPESPVALSEETGCERRFITLLLPQWDLRMTQLQPLQVLLSRARSWPLDWCGR